jgi:ankyrin repeat protein
MGCKISSEKILDHELFFAARAGDLISVIIFVEQGISVNYSDPKTGDQALMMAAHSENFQLVDFLLANGADCTAKNKSGYVALSFAARNGNLAIGKKLLDALLGLETINTRSTRSNETPLMQAVFGGHVDFIKMLLDHGADPSLTTTYGYSAIDFAKSQRRVDIVSLLINNKKQCGKVYM